MSRITGTDAFNMMEAYNAVYAPQELTEEQVWEEVEAWVNSLVEEGYDLSEYTWEDMYGAYIEEQGPRSSRGVSDPAVQARWGQIGRTIMYGQSGQPAPRKPTAQQQMRQRIQASRSGAKPQIGSLPSDYRGQELQQAARARASQVGTPRQGTAGGPTTGGNTPIGPSPTRPVARPAAPVATRPAATAPAAPAAAKPASTAAAAPAASSIERRTPTSAELRQAQQLRTAGSNLTGAGALAPSKTLSTASRNLSGTGALATRPATPSPAPAAAPKPNLQQQIRQRRLNMDFDPFDVVQGYLIDEGYAETEEAAAVIMANMSEEWKESILESGYFPTKESQMKDEAKYNLRGQTAKPRTAQTQAKPTPSNLK